MPLVWDLIFPMVVEGDLERCRLVYEQLLHDPAVHRLSVTENVANRFIRSVRVEFNEGVDGPSNPTLRALPQQFPNRTPVRSVIAQTEDITQWTRQICQGLQVPEELLDASRHISINQNPCAEISLGPKPLKPSELPPWFRPGLWVEFNAVPHHIQRIDSTAVDSLCVILRAWSSDAAYSEIGVVLLSDTLALFRPCGKPAVLRTWHARILDDD